MSVFDIFGFWENDNYWSHQELSSEILRLKLEYESEFSWIDKMAIHYRMIDWWHRLMIHIGVCIVGLGLTFLSVSAMSAGVIVGSYILSTTLLIWHAESLAKRFLQLTSTIQCQQEILNSQIHESGQLILQLEEQIEIQASKTNSLQQEAIKAVDDLTKIRRFCAVIELDFQTLSGELKHYRQVILQRIDAAQKIFSNTELSTNRLI